MNFMQLIEHIAGQGILLALMLIIALGIGTAFDQRFPRDRLLRVFNEEGFPGAFLAAAISAIFPPATGGTIPLAACFQQLGGAWSTALSFAVAGSALSLPAIVLTLTLGWRIAMLRLASAVLFGLVSGIVIRSRIGEKLKAAKRADWLTLCESDYCDIRPEREEWETTYPWRSFGTLLLSNLRIAFPWLVFSLLVATLFTVGKASAQFIGLYGHWWSPLLAAGTGFPFFLAMGTDVPIVGAVLSKGVPVATALSFMLGAPVVNFPVYIMLRRWLGKRLAVEILVSCFLVAAALGWFVALTGWLGSLV